MRPVRVFSRLVDFNSYRLPRYAIRRGIKRVRPVQVVSAIKANDIAEWSLGLQEGIPGPDRRKFIVFSHGGLWYFVPVLKTEYP